jgi:hypothetical protein
MLKIVVEGLYMVITCIFFLVFALNVFVIYSTSKIINVSCNDNIMNLSYIIIVILCIYIYF